MGEPGDLRKRVDALNCQPMPERPAPDVDREDIRRRIRKLGKESARPPAAAILYRRDLPRESETKLPPQPQLPGPFVRLEEAVEGVEVEAPHGGRAYVIQRQVGEAAADSLATAEALCEGHGCVWSGLARRARESCGAEGARPEDVLFLDLETTGLSSTSLFLVGTLVWEQGAPVVQQYFARDYAEERAVISLFLEGLARKKLLVSFNGRTFDLPYVRVRAAANGLPFQVSIAHLDMLPECRRAWRHVLPDCRLQTLESRICGRTRRCDIPGSEIPDAYHAFVRTGNAARIVQVVEHNMFDLVTLAELVGRLPHDR